MINNIFLLFGVMGSLFTVASILGSYAAFKFGFNKTANEIQARVIEAYKHEQESLYAKIDTLSDEMAEVKGENSQLKQIYEILIESLEKQGIFVTLTAGMLHIENKTTGFTQKSRIGSKTIDGKPQGDHQ